MDGDLSEETRRLADRTGLGATMTVDRMSDRCFPRMVHLARSLIRHYGFARTVDAEKVANAALYRLCKADGDGKLAEATTSDEFWKYTKLLLVRETLREQHQ